MKIKKILILCLVLMFSIGCLVACNNDEPPVGSIEFAEQAITMDLYSSQVLSPIVKDTTELPKFSSSNSAVVSVDDSGKIVATGVGSAQITAKIGDLEAKCTVTVVGTDYVPTLRVSDKSVSLTIDDEYALTAIVQYNGIDVSSNATFSWTVQDGAKASITPNGSQATVKALALGETTVTVSAVLGDTTLQTIVPVNVFSNTVLSFDDSVEVVDGKFVVDLCPVSGAQSPTEFGIADKFSVVVNDKIATDFDVTYQSADSSIATVDASGNVTAVAPGETVIYLTVGDAVLGLHVNVERARIVKTDKTYLLSLFDSAKYADDGTFAFKTNDALKFNYDGANGKLVGVIVDGNTVFDGELSLTNGENSVNVNYSSFTSNRVEDLGATTISFLTETSEYVYDAGIYTQVLTTTQDVQNWVKVSVGLKTLSGNKPDGYFILGNNVTASDYWVYHSAVMDGSNFSNHLEGFSGFVGLFDGNGYYIEKMNMQVDDERNGEFAGFVPTIAKDGIVRNVGFVDCKFTIDWDSGNNHDKNTPYFSSRSGFIASCCAGTINDVYIDFEITTSKDKAVVQYFGGITHRTNGATENIQRCIVDCQVNSKVVLQWYWSSDISFGIFEPNQTTIPETSIVNNIFVITNHPDARFYYKGNNSAQFANENAMADAIGTYNYGENFTASLWANAGIPMLAQYNGNYHFEVSDSSGVALNLLKGESTYDLSNRIWGVPHDEITWTANSNIVTVENGLVTALAGGEVTITATYGTHSQDFVFSIIDREIVEVSVETAPIEMLDRTAPDGTYRFSSSKPFTFTVGSATEPLEKILLNGNLVYTETENKTLGSQLTVNLDLSKCSGKSIYLGAQKMQVFTTGKIYEFDVTLYTQILSSVADIQNWVDVALAFGNDGYFVLGNNVTASDYWVYHSAVMDGSNFSNHLEGFSGFVGIFDGNGYYIEKMNIQVDDERNGEFAGFIPTIAKDGIVRNVAFIDCKFTIDWDSGNNHDKNTPYFSSRSGFIASCCAGTINDVYIDFEITTSKDKAVVQYFGGITHRTNGATENIQRCIVDCQVNSKVVLQWYWSSDISFGIFEPNQTTIPETAVVNNIFVITNQTGARFKYTGSNSAQFGDADAMAEAASTYNYAENFIGSMWAIDQNGVPVVASHSLDISFTKESVTLYTGDFNNSFDLNTVLSMKYPGIQWSIDNAEVVSIENGVVTSIKAGTANITAKYGNLQDTIVVIVEVPDVEHKNIDDVFTIETYNGNSSAIGFISSKEINFTSSKDETVTSILIGDALVFSGSKTLTANTPTTITLDFTNFGFGDMSNYGYGKDVVIITNKTIYHAKADILTMAIDTIEEVQNWLNVAVGLKNYANGKITGYFVLTDDIDSDSYWAYIPTHGGQSETDYSSGFNYSTYTGFEGIFDGQGHYIDKMNMVVSTDNNWQAFIPVLASKGELKNVAFTNSKITLQQNLGWSGFLTASCAGSITDVYLDVDVVSDTTVDTRYIYWSGIIAAVIRNKNQTIKNIVVEVDYVSPVACECGWSSDMSCAIFMDNKIVTPSYGAGVEIGNIYVVTNQTNARFYWVGTNSGKFASTTEMASASSTYNYATNFTGSMWAIDANGLPKFASTVEQ